jgi:hypothetical protein
MVSFRGGDAVASFPDLTDVPDEYKAAGFQMMAQTGRYVIGTNAHIADLAESISLVEVPKPGGDVLHALQDAGLHPRETRRLGESPRWSARWAARGASL